MRAKRILLVEDDPLARRALCKALEAEGYDAIALEDGAEAVARLREEPFDVVITDLVMDGADGVQVLRQAKERDPDSSVMIMSGYCDANSAIDALRLGAEDYLAKPFDYEELLLRVARCLESRDLRRKLKLYENILPVCAGCRRIRVGPADEEPEDRRWLAIEEYLAHKGAEPALDACCPECEEKALGRRTSR